MERPTIMSDTEVIVELCDIIAYQQKRIEQLEDEVKYLKSENSTLKSESQ